MKKLLAILSSATLAVSTTATVVACGQTTKDNIDLSKFNNSLPNMQGSAASVAQQLILADQFGLSTKTLQSNLGGLSAKDVVEKTTGLEYDSQDFNLGDNSDLTDLNDQYFGNLNLNEMVDEDKIGENINLEGTIGLKNDQLWRFLKDSLGVDLGETSGIITTILKVLSNLNSFGLQDLLQQMLPSFNLGDLLEEAGLNKDLLKLISLACRSLFKDEEFLKSLNIENFDIGTTFSEMKVEHITSAAMVSLSNSIGLFVNADYKTTEFSTTDFEKDDSEVEKIVAKNLEEAGDNVGEIIAKALIPDKKTSDSRTLAKNFFFDFDKFSDNLNKDIERYAKAIANLFQFLEFLQLQFSLFDDIKDYQPKDNQHLFNDTQTNKEYLKDILGSGKKLSEVTDVNEEGKVQGSLNLKYLLSTFKNAFSDLEHGYNLQRFLAILFLDFKDVDPDQWDDKMASPFSSWLTQVLDQVLFQLIKSLGISIPENFESTVRNMILKPVVLPFLTTILDSLLSGQSLQKAFHYLVINLMKTVDKILLLDNLGKFLDDDTRALLELISSAQGFLTEILINLLNLIPLVTAENSFKELYEGNPLDLKPLIEKLKEIEEVIGDLLPIFNVIISALESFSNSSFLPDNKELNLKNLLTTPLNKINSQSIIPPGFGGYYLEKSIVEIVDDVCEIVHVNGHEILKGEGENVIPEAFNFKISYLKDIFNMIIKYDYEGVPEGYQGDNLISIILENPDQFAKILGLVDENGKKSFAEGSLLYLIFHDILKVQDSGKDGNVDNDPFAFFITLLSSVFNNLNSPNLDYTEAFKTLFNNEKTFEFTYNPPVSDDEVLLGQIMIVKYHNPENDTNWTYTINYSREKVSDYFKIRLLKKEAV